MPNECTADLDHPCDASNGESCDDCAANERYWLNQWERYGRREVVRERFYTENELRSAYSDPAEHSKLVSLLGEQG